MASGPVAVIEVKNFTPRPAVQTREVAPGRAVEVLMPISGATLDAAIAAAREIAANALTPRAYALTSVSTFTAGHGLAYLPEAWIVGSDGEVVDTDTLHTPGAVTVVFAQPFTGTLYVR